MSEQAVGTIPEQFESRAQQEETASLGIWTFLSTEILFFGGLILSYTVYRLSYHAGFVEASQHLYFWVGTINTLILLTSSLCMALAVHSIEDGDSAGNCEPFPGADVRLRRRLPRLEAVRILSRLPRAPRADRQPRPD